MTQTLEYEQCLFLDFQNYSAMEVHPNICGVQVKRRDVDVCSADLMLFSISSGIARILILKSTHVMCRSMSKSKEGCLDKMSF